MNIVGFMSLLIFTLPTVEATGENWSALFEIKQLNSKKDIFIPLAFLHRIQ